MTGPLQFEGLAAIFGEPDQNRDVFDPGAFAESLASGRKVRLLSNHKPDCVIGCVDHLAETDAGLYIRAHITPDLEVSRDVGRLILDGALDGLSVGFKTKRSRYVGSNRHIVVAELWEISVVTFPMALGARIVSRNAQVAALMEERP